MTLSALPEKIPETIKNIFLIFIPSPNVVLLNQLTNLVQIRYLGLSYKYLQPLFSFQPTLKIKGSSRTKKIKIRLSSVISNALLIEINLSQIRT